MESDKRSAMLIWASIGAAAAGIVAVAVLARLRQTGREDLTTQLRDVQDVLSDCYRKIQDIENHLPEMASEQSTRQLRMSSRSLPVGNGTPVQ